MIDYDKLLFSTKVSSNKLAKEGSGTFSVAALPGVGEVHGSVTIPHGLGTDNLLFQVSTSTDTAGATIDTVLPWQSNSGSVFIYADIDDTNLVIHRINSDTSGFGFSACTVLYVYRVLVP